jgi:hypothetical protein
VWYGVVLAMQVADIDFFADGPFPSGFDVITMGMILHDWGPQKKKLLVQKVGPNASHVCCICSTRVTVWCLTESGTFPIAGCMLC